MSKKNTLNNLAHEIRTVLRSDRDFLVAISGKTGEGKSTLGQQIAFRVDPKFNIKKNTVFTRDEFVDLIKNGEDIPKYSCIVADEAINILYRRDFMQAGQKELLRLLDMCRDRNLCMILCVPNVWSLDKHILDSRLRAWIHVENRGTGMVFIPDENPFTTDRWHRKINEKVLKNWNSGVNPTKSKNYLGSVSYSDLSPDKRKLYLEVKVSKKEDAEKYDQKGKKKVKDEKTVATNVLYQLYKAGKIKEKDLREIGNSGTVAKNYQGLKTKFGMMERNGETQNE